jgi:surface antigen
MRLQWTVAVMALAFLQGCAATSLGARSSGSVIGGFVGTPASAGGAQIAENLILAMGGGLLVGEAGEELSQKEKTRALEAEYRALEYTPVGQTVTWGDKPSGRYGEVVAAQAYRVGSQDCRQYSHTVHAGGQPRVARGTACRNADGSWTTLT